jgi:hypothetical protein
MELLAWLNVRDEDITFAVVALKVSATADPGSKATHTHMFTVT